MRVTLGENLIENWVRGSRGISEEAQYVLAVLVSRDAFARKTAEFYADFYSELEKVEGISLPNVEAFTNVLYS